MATLVEDIIQALNNLGGQATLNQIYDQVEKIRTVPLAKSWKANIRGVIENNSSDSTRFLGKDRFRKLDRGLWSLLEPGEIQSSRPIIKKTIERKHHARSNPDSFETITIVLKTIKEYRDFTQPDSPTWVDYVQELFHILKFNIEKLEAQPKSRFFGEKIEQK